MSTDKQQILETITAVSRLITLAFKPKTTKISIRDHNIVLCEPKIDSYYGFKIPQSVDRYWNGDSREDIYVLNHVICNFIELYVIPYKNTDVEIYKGLINLAKYLCVALKQLQNTYVVGNAASTLQYYINVLTAVIDDNFDSEMLYNPVLNDRKSFLGDESYEAADIAYSTIFDIDKIKRFWKRDELKSLCDQFEKCFVEPGQRDNVVFGQRPTVIMRPDLIHSDGVVGSLPNEHKLHTASPPKNENSIQPSSVSDDMIMPFSSSQVSAHTTPHLIPDTPDHIESDVGSVGQSTGQLIDLSAPIDIKQSKRASVTIDPRPSPSVKSGKRRWPTPRSQNNVIVQGTLVGISNILDMMDRRFSATLAQSVKGTK